MKFIQYAVYKKETGNAGGKAKNDAFDIMHSLGFKPSYQPSKSRLIRIIQQLISMAFIGNDSVLFVQYPSVSRPMMNFLVKKIKRIKCSILLVHDLRSIQGHTSEYKNEIDIINCFDYVIAHNSQMKNYLVNEGCTSKIYELNAFDYLHDVDRELMNNDYNGSICFAGNLTKSSFINYLNVIDNVKFYLYGQCNIEPNYSNTLYGGLLPSDEIVYKLEGNYGLVWDGPSIETCTGDNGDYLKYNNPHKMSLYIAAGKPIITWKKAAISKFVIENKIGFAVDSLEELNEIDLQKNFAVYKDNIYKLKKNVGDGYYLKKAIKVILQDNGYQF